MSRILFVGLGDLGSQVLDAAMRMPGQHAFLVAGRNVEHMRKRANTSLFAAMQLGMSPRIDVTYMDVENIDQTASTIASFQPDLLFSAVTLQPWFSIQA